MNDLKGKFLNIVLSIEEGRGFDSVKTPLFLTANFNGRIMESDVLDSHPNIIFNTEMVWETEKKLLRKARGAYGRVRIECFTTEKKFIGFMLLGLRSAHIIPSSRTNLEIPYSWNKLLNIPTEFKKGTPELNVSLTIRDYISSNALPPAIQALTPIPQLPENSTIQIPIKSTSNGYIQVGNDDASLDYYQFKITSKVASNLDTLLPESLVFSQTPKKYFLEFSIFGMPVKTRNVARDLHENINVNETVVVKLLSNFNILKMYFQQFPIIPVTFFNDDTQLGTTHIYVGSMSWNLDPSHLLKNGKLELEEECFFENPTSELIERRPSLTTKITVEMINQEGQGEIAGILSPKIRYSPGLEGESLVENKPRAQSCIERRPNFLQNLLKIEENLDPSCVTLTSNSSPQMLKVEDSNPFDTYKQFSLDLIIDTITWRKPPKGTTYFFNFQHPKSNTSLTIKTDIEKQINRRIFLDNVVCKLIFISTSGRANALITLFNPKMQMKDSKKQKICQDFILDTSQIPSNKQEFTQMVSLKNSKNEEIAEISISAFLEVSDIKKGPTSQFELLPYILDDNILLQDLEELEQWKAKERERFKNEIEKMRKDELSVLHEDWMSRKTKLENDLKNNITRCKKLSRQLKKNANNMKLDKILEKKREENDFNFYLEVHKNSVKYSLFENHELIETISNLEGDCAVLKDLLSEQNIEMEEIRQNVLTGEQTKNLLHDLKTLEEKYEEAQKDKNYFKMEWEKAVKEVHSLKVEDQKNLQTKIAVEKEELSQLSLDKFIGLDDEM